MLMWKTYLDAYMHIHVIEYIICHYVLALEFIAPSSVGINTI